MVAETEADFSVRSGQGSAVFSTRFNSYRKQKIVENANRHGMMPAAEKGAPSLTPAPTSALVRFLSL